VPPPEGARFDIHVDGVANDGPKLKGKVTGIDYNILKTGSKGLKN